MNRFLRGLFACLVLAFALTPLQLPVSAVAVTATAATTQTAGLPVLNYRPDSMLLIWCDFSLCQLKGMTQTQRDTAFWEASRCVTPMQYVGMTTEMPYDRRSGTYMTCRVLPRFQVPDRQSAGSWTEKNLYLQTELFGTNTSYVLWGDPDVGGVQESWYVGRLIAHEACGHGFQSPTFPGHANVPDLFDPFASGANFGQQVIDSQNLFGLDLAKGRRLGVYLPPGGGAWTYDWHWRQDVDPNWPLPVCAAGWLVFDPGPVPPCLSVPAGWGMVVSPIVTGGKLAADWNTRTLYHPGPVGGAPGADPAGGFTFAAGAVPRAVYGPDRGGGVTGWVVRHGNGFLRADPSTRVVNMP